MLIIESKSGGTKMFLAFDLLVSETRGECLVKRKEPVSGKCYLICIAAEGVSPSF